MRHLFTVAIVALAGLGLAGCLSHPTATPIRQILWSKGQDGYHTARIPALCTTRKGTLLAFCEGRREGAGDSGDIDLILRRSTDNGRTWSPTQVVWDDDKNTCGNPCPIVDRNTGTIWLLITWNRGDDCESTIINGKSKDTRRVFATCSTNDGKSWEKPQDITSTAKAADWTWYATGPGAGIQIENGPHQGRLVAPCDHMVSLVEKRYYSHIIYSDDHGKTWQLGGSTPEAKVNECQVVELAEGNLLLNMRNYDRSKLARQVAFSADGGANWTRQHHDDALVEPICQASLRRLSWPKKDQPGVILFLNPANPASRSNLTLRASLDDGQTWSGRLQIHAGPAAYSDLAILRNGQIGCLYEGGDSQDPYETIIFKAIDPKRLLNRQ
jgi:sialidase-1